MPVCLSVRRSQGSPKRVVRSCETHSPDYPGERGKKRARMKRTGESRERQRLPDILSITIIGFST